MCENAFAQESYILISIVCIVDRASAHNVDVVEWCGVRSISDQYAVESPSNLATKSWIVEGHISALIGVPRQFPLMDDQPDHPMRDSNSREQQDVLVSDFCGFLS